MKRLHGFRGAATPSGGWPWFRRAAEQALDSTLLAEKVRMRRRFRAVRARLAWSRETASAAAARLAPLERWRSARVVSGYVASPSEIDPAPLLARCAAAGAQVVLPVVIARGAALVFRHAVAAEALSLDAAGIVAPPPWAAEARPGVVIVPLLAFDRAGGRLGQGGGYYDRTLGALRAAGPVTAVGLAYAGQEVDHTPMDEFDERLDAILTEREYIEV